jgi:hypothetical protein
VHALACDAVGTALVDDREPGGAPVLVPCTKPPECEEPDAGPPVAPRALLPVDMEQCRLDRESPCVPPGDAGAPDEETVAVELPAEELDGGADVPCGPEPTEQCGLVVVESTGGDDAPQSTTFSEPVWSGVEVVARSEQPFEVVIDGGWLFDVSITLDGPITLWIHAAEFVEQVRVRTVDDRPGEARLVIEDSRAEQLSAGEPEHRFAGSIDVLRSELRDVQLIARDLQLESGKLLGGFVAIDELSGIDAELSDLELTFGDALLAAFQLRRTRISYCGALTLIEGDARDTQFPNCERRPARIYSTGIVGGTFDGIAEADRSRFAGVVLGLADPTELIAWNSHFLSVALCEHADAFVLASVSSMRCSSCPDGTPDAPERAPPEGDALRTPPVAPPDLTGAPPENLCFIPSPSDEDEEAPTEGNFCELPPIPPLCDEPHPVRRRPLPEPF